MTTEWIHSTCSSEHQVAVVSVPSDNLVFNGTMTGAMVSESTHMRVITNTSCDSDSGYNDTTRGDSPSEPSVIFSTPVTTRLRQPPLRTPSVIVSDCSDVAASEPIELLLCNGDVNAEKYDNHIEDRLHQSSASPTLSSNSQSSSSQEMDSAEHQVSLQFLSFTNKQLEITKKKYLSRFLQGWSVCWPPPLRKNSSSSGFLFLPGQDDESSMILSSNLLAVRRLSDCSSSSSLATLDMEPCCSGACMADPTNHHRSPSASSDPLVEDEDEAIIKPVTDDSCPSSQLPEEGCIAPHSSSSLKVRRNVFAPIGEYRMNTTGRICFP